MGALSFHEAMAASAVLHKYSDDEARDADGRWSGPGVMWHGSPSGDLRGGKNGLHVGTHEAARQALNARIGIPAKGEWDGSRKYGETMLAGRKTLAAAGPYLMSGHNADAPDEDYMPTKMPTYGDKTEVSRDAMPNIFPVRIVGPMTNHPGAPLSDTKANATMSAQITRGSAKRGYFYRNIAEDDGSISAVVPSGSHLQRLDVHKYDPSEARDEHGRWTFGGVPADGIASHERKSLLAYQDAAYGRINRSLYGTSTATPETAEHIKNIDAVMARSTLSKPAILFRGMMDDGGVFSDDKLVGQTRNNPAFQSASRNMAVALNRVDDGNPADHMNAYVMQISAPAGTHALDFNGAVEHNENPHEEEVLLDRNTKMRIDKIDHNSRHVWATVVR